MKTTEATQPSTKEQHINPYDIQNRRTTSPNTPRNKKSNKPHYHKTNRTSVSTRRHTTTTAQNDNSEKVNSLTNKVNDNQNKVTSIQEQPMQ